MTDEEDDVSQAVPQSPEQEPGPAPPPPAVKAPAKGSTKPPAKPSGKPAAKPAAKPAPADGDKTINKGPSKASQANREKRAREIERRKAEAAALAAKKRRQRLLSAAVPIGLIVLIVGAYFIFHKASPPPPKPVAVTTVPFTSAELASMVTPTVGAPGAEGVPIPGGSLLADLGKAGTGKTIDGIQCQANEATVSHTHTHLSIYVDGVAKQVPALVGIQNNVCFYWLHTHVNDGILHVESPDSRTFTLGEFFDLWGQPLSTTQVGPASGPVTVVYNGQKFTGTDPRTIPLQAHDHIQLEVGTPLVLPVTETFGNVQ